jgi:RluA family pseudouridine synthase
VSNVIKLSAPATQGFWEIPVLFEDEHLLALDKPAGLPTSPDRVEVERPSLMGLLHAAIAAGKPWARERGLTYLCNAHRLDGETSGVLLLAKSKPVLLQLANLFGTDRPEKTYLALARGEPAETHFEVSVKLAPHPVTPGLMRADFRDGKAAKTIFDVRESFPRSGHVLLGCRPVTERRHQIRVHAAHVGLKIVGDELYGGKPLWLSRLKTDYRLKPGREERPLLARAALHAEQLTFEHPVTKAAVTLTAPWPKDLKVAVKYLRQYSV